MRLNVIHIISKRGEVCNPGVNVGDYIVGRWGNPYKVLKRNVVGYELRCPSHGVFTVSNKHLGKLCPDCPKKASRLNFVAKARVVHGNTYQYKKVNYTDSKSKVTISCRIHGDFLQEPRNHLVGKGCPDCGVARQAEKLRLSPEDIAAKKKRDKELKVKLLASRVEERKILWKKIRSDLEEIYNGAYQYKPCKPKSGRFRTFGSIIATCVTHNVTSKVSLSGHIKGIDICPECNSEKKLARRRARIKATAARRKMRLKERQEAVKLNKIRRRLQIILRGRAKFLEALRSLNDGMDYSEFVYFDEDSTKSTVSCPIHGKFKATAGRILRSKFPCPRCESSNRSKITTKTTKHFIKLSTMLHGTKYDYSKSSYRGKKFPITVTCKRHGDFEVKAGYHMHKKTNYGGCPKCRKYSVKRFGGRLESNIIRYISSLGISSKAKDRKTIKPYEIDILVPSKSFGIEVNGIYWHSSKFRGKDYHTMKASMAEDAGVVLYQFWCKEIEQSAGIVKSMIRAALGKSEIIYARKTKVRKVTTQDRRNFFQKNHLQSDARATVAYGLYVNDKLVACMSFGRPRFSKSYDWEIIRFANVRNTTVVGGASKLWSRFLRDYNPDSVLSYADRRFSVGNVYLKLGFKNKGATPPNYFWHNKFGEIVTRYDSQKHKLGSLLGDKFDSSLTEVENMEKSRNYRVYDAGSYRMVWNKGS